MFDAAVMMGPPPEGSFYAFLVGHGHRIVRDQDFVECYAERIGPPSIPPSQLAKVLLLGHRTGASDEEAMECVRWDLRWKAALDLPVDHQGWHPTLLTKFRARLLLGKKDGLALENTLRLARELGMLDGSAERIVDSTPMRGAAATQDTVRLVRCGVRKLIDAVSTADRAAGEVLAAGLEFNYERPGEKPECQWRLKAGRERMLTRVAQDAQRALLAVEQADGLLEQESVKAAWELLGELIGQDFDVDQDGVPTLHRGTRPGRIISTIDREMQRGRKYEVGDAQAVAAYSSLVLASSRYPGGLPQEPRIAYVPESRQLVVELDLPPIDVVPVAIKYLYVRAKDEFAAKTLPAAKRTAIYTRVVAQITLRTISELLRADRARHYRLLLTSDLVATLRSC